MSLEECRVLIDMYDGAESSERKQLQALLQRLAVIAADLGDRKAELQRTLNEVKAVSEQCQDRLASLGYQ